MSEVNYAPYSHNERLYLPTITAHLLKQAGLNTSITMDAISGLHLNDDSAKIAKLNEQLQDLIIELDATSVAKIQLTSPEVKFIFSHREHSNSMAYV